ncbi:J domain-containing protein [Legionella sp.]|uniref:J domain-containing protein n=1 Tax=Legionella sp. TaxID=459 RepID=UPI003C843E08
MKSLLEKLSGEWEDYSDGGKKKFLDNLLKEYSNVSYYLLFNVPQNMSSEDIKTVNTSFKKLALILHPDKLNDKIYMQSAQELFKLLNNAHATLTDNTKEQTYRLKVGVETKKPTSQPDVSSRGSHQWSNNGPSFHRNNLYTTFSTYTFSTSAGSSKRYDRDIQVGETISAQNEDIFINGNVYGDVKNMSGDITITGNVFGKVNNMNGANIIKSNVERDGNVSNMNGANIIKGNVERDGNVSNMYGDNEIKGKVSGNVTKNKSSGGAFFSNVNVKNFHTNGTTYFSFN